MRAHKDAPSRWDFRSAVLDPNWIFNILLHRDIPQILPVSYRQWKNTVVHHYAQLLWVTTNTEGVVAEGGAMLKPEKG